MPNYNGKLILSLVRANDLRRVQLLGKQDPYVEVVYKKDRRKTKVAKDGDRSPVWNQALDVKIENDAQPYVTLNVINKNVTLDETIATLRVPVAVLVSSEAEHWIPLFKEEQHRSKAGKLLLSAKFEGTKGLPATPNPSRYGLVSAHYGVDTLTADVLGFLEAKVADLKLRFAGSQDLSGYFGFDPLDHHMSGKKLMLSYLRNDKVVRVEIGEKHKDVVIQLEDYGMRAADAKAAQLAEKAAESKAAAAQLEKEKAEAEARAAKEAEMKAAYLAQMNKTAADLKSAQEMNMLTANNLAITQAKVEELKRQQAELEGRVQRANARAAALEREKNQKLADFVCYGARYRLRHKASGKYLVSAKGVKYPNGSHQQEVGCSPGGDAKAREWVVGCAWRVHPDGALRTGDRVMNQDMVRLTHVQSGNRLHTHGERSWKHRDQQEVTCFDGPGRDENDDWRVECDGGWRPGAAVRLVQINENAALHSHDTIRDFNAKLQDVTAVKNRRDDNDLWVAEAV